MLKKNLIFYRKSFYSSIIFCNLLCACAPGLGSSVNLNSISKVSFEQAVVYTEEDKVKLNVLNFSDNRPIEAIVQIDGRLIKPDGDVGLAAKKIFESMAKKAGIKLTLFNSPSVRGAIKDWSVTVVPGFPASKLEATATLNLDILDTQSNVILTSTYSGTYEEQNPFMTDSRIESSLGKAMTFAVGEALKDNAFVSSLSSVANSAHEQNY